MVLKDALERIKVAPRSAVNVLYCLGAMGDMYGASNVGLTALLGLGEKTSAVYSAVDKAVDAGFVEVRYFEGKRFIVLTEDGRAILDCIRKELKK